MYQMAYYMQYRAVIHEQFTYNAVTNLVKTLKLLLIALSMEFVEWKYD